jgi:hypothetical protein
MFVRGHEGDRSSLAATAAARAINWRASFLASPFPIEGYRNQRRAVHAEVDAQEGSHE